MGGYGSKNANFVIVAVMIVTINKAKVTTLLTNPA